MHATNDLKKARDVLYKTFSKSLESNNASLAVACLLWYIRTDEKLIANDNK